MKNKNCKKSKSTLKILKGYKKEGWDPNTNISYNPLQETETKTMGHVKTDVENITGHVKLDAGHLP